MWGGWCERFDAHAQVDARTVGAPWPVSLEELAPHYRAVERLLTVRNGPGVEALEAKIGVRATAPRIARSGLQVRTALSFKHARARAITQAVVRRVVFKGSRAVGVEYWNEAGTLEEAFAKTVVLCASPEETVRILLTEPPSPIADRAHLLGQGLVDHVMVSYVAAAPVPVKKTRAGAAAFVPRFVNTGRATKKPYVGGFSMEVHGPVDASKLSPGWWPMLRLDRKRAAEASAFIVTAMGDSLPHPRRAISLHPSEKDALGRPVPVIHQYTSHNDRRLIADMRETALTVIDAMTPPGSIIVPFRDPSLHRALFHEAGGARMGHDPKTTVTDAWGRVRETEGLYVADASVLPTGGDRHPTLTLLALAARTAEHIVRVSKAGF